MEIVGFAWLFIVGLIIGGTAGWILRDLCEGAWRRREDELSVADIESRADEILEDSKKEEVSIK